MKRLAVMLLFSFAAGCNCGSQKLGEKCTSGMGAFDTAQADCASGLVCDINDACDSNCPGSCVLPCSSDAGCPAACSCTGNSRFVVGRNICAGPGC